MSAPTLRGGGDSTLCAGRVVHWYVVRKLLQGHRRPIVEQTGPRVDVLVAGANLHASWAMGESYLPHTVLPHAGNKGDDRP